MSLRAPQAMALLLFPLVAYAAYNSATGLRSAQTEQAIARKAARPTPVVAADGVALAAPDRTHAEKALAQLLGDRASAAGVRLATGATTAGADGHIAAMDVVADGGEAAVLRFAAAIETGRPTARLDRWSFAPTATGLRLEGRAIAVWRSGDAPPPAPGQVEVRVPAPRAASPAPAAGLFAAATAPRLRSGFPAELIGIVGRIAVDPQAMLRLPDGKMRTVAIGETVEGWALASISADRVQFRRGAEEKTLVLPTAAE